MKKLSNWRLAQKLQASGRKGVILGLAIAALVILIVAVVLIKARWLKKKMDRLHYDFDELSDDFDDDCDECAMANEKDFV